MTPVSDNNDHHQPTGNLEELFRQKFAEAELPPRTDVWDRLDHELLLRENQGYRRRLVGYRRLAAAACAVATLGVGGWLTQRVTGPATSTELAAIDSAAAARAAAARLGAAADPQAAPAGAATASTNGSREAAGTPATTRRGTTGVATAAGTAASAGSNDSGSSVLDNLRESFGSAERTDHAAQPSLASRALAAIKQTFGGRPEAAGAGAGSRMAAESTAGIRSSATSTTSVASLSSVAAPEAAASTLAPRWSADALQPVASRLGGVGMGSGLPDSLKSVLVNSSETLLAAQLAEEEAREEKKNASVSRWRWRGGYAAQRFVPNVSSLAGTGIALRPTATANSAPTAPNTYRTYDAPTKLQPGLAQRGQLGVAVPLGKKHWTLLTGAELAVVSGSADRQVAKQYSAQGVLQADQQLQTGRYHLTSVGVPVQVRYESRKQGWGVYAAVGAAVNVLLRNRTAVGPQTTTDDATYRRVLATARGSAGVRFMPAGGNWQLNLGPEAEAGLTTLNTNPTENWSQRTRPYAVGLSASVEFGGGKAELAP
jgi:hypothetical protein